VPDTRTNQGKQSRELHEAFNFRVLIDRGLGDGAEASFARCGPVESTVSVASYREAGSPIPIKDPDELSFADITLERGASRSPLFAAWMAEVSQAITGVGGGRVVPPYYKRTVSIFQKSRKKDGTLKKIILYNAMPITFRAGDWDNDRDEIVIESLTFCYDYYLIRIDKPG
jgi:phage tail-like protein